jgi:hypothetical protein
MRNAWSWLGLELGKRAGIVALVGLLATVALGLGMTHLTFETSNNSYLNTNDRAQIETNAYNEAQFGGDPLAAMFTMVPGKTVDDLYPLHNELQFLVLESKLKRDPWVSNYITPLDVMVLADRISYSSDGNPTDSVGGTLLSSAYARDLSPQGRKARLAYITALLAAESMVPFSQRNLSNPAWAHFLAHRPRREDPDLIAVVHPERPACGCVRLPQGKPLHRPV